MHFERFNQEDLLIDRWKLAQTRLSCLICHQLLRWPVHCLGCQSEYCRQCALKWRQESDRCPLRCSSPWEIEESEPKYIELKCPIGQNCTPISPESFQEHLVQCLRSQLQRRYQCTKEHKLTYMTTAQQIVCADCGKLSLGRSVCLPCKESGDTFMYYYCSRCRTPLLSKEICPVGHEFVHILPKGGFVCNICGQSSAKRRLCHRDRQCNFAICEICYRKIPDNPAEKRQPEEP